MNTPQRDQGADEVGRIGGPSWSVMDVENESVSDTTALSAVSAGLALLMAGIPVMKVGTITIPSKYNAILSYIQSLNYQ